MHYYEKVICKEYKEIEKNKEMSDEEWKRRSNRINIATRELQKIQRAKEKVKK